VRSSSYRANTYELYAQLTADSKVVASGTFTAPALTVAGVTYQVSGSPQAGDQFAVMPTPTRTRACWRPSASCVLRWIRRDGCWRTCAEELHRFGGRQPGQCPRAGRYHPWFDRCAWQLARDPAPGEHQPDLANKTTQDAIGNTDMAEASIMLALHQAGFAAGFTQISS
jgi:flagellar hook-associated protein 3 FlgL